MYVRGALIWLNSACVTYLVRTLVRPKPHQPHPPRYQLASNVRANEHTGARTDVPTLAVPVTRNGALRGQLRMCTANDARCVGSLVGLRGVAREGLVHGKGLDHRTGRVHATTGPKCHRDTSTNLVPKYHLVPTLVPTFNVGTSY